MNRAEDPSPRSEARDADGTQARRRPRQFAGWAGAISLLLATAGAAGCLAEMDPSPYHDAGAVGPDAGGSPPPPPPPAPSDAGTGGDLPGDGGLPDGGVPDGGIPDGGVPDGGIPDGGVPDGGVPDDGGIPDGGVPDGGIPDGGVPDGGGPDAGCPGNSGRRHDAGCPGNSGG